MAALTVLSLLFLISGAWLVWNWPVGMINYGDFADSATASVVSTVPIAVEPPKPAIVHVATPRPLKAIYITACTASEKKLRDRALALFDGTELNAIVIDAKDYTGTLAYASSHLISPIDGDKTQNLSVLGRGCRILDLPQFVAELHERGIYAIARITVFQDPLYSVRHPESAVKSKSAPGALWHDKKGLSYIDPAAVSFWDYIVDYSKELYGIGFDELNYDYIRFPSDGDMTDVSYDLSSTTPRAEVMRNFFAYLRAGMSDTPATLSADLFGLTTSAMNDLGIGQVLEDALAYFDYVAPMVYPSHFAYGFIGIARPATKPYEVVKYSMDMAVGKALAASSTPTKLRSWLQAFDLGANYTPDMVRAQINATYDAGLDSWMLWNAASVYDKRALVPPPTDQSTTTVIHRVPLPVLE